MSNILDSSEGYCKFVSLLISNYERNITACVENVENFCGEAKNANQYILCVSEDILINISVTLCVHSLKISKY